jgi:patatin-related protein
MREKELRLALICYGGVSLAIYMHGVTKEIWHLVRASRNHHDNNPPVLGSEQIYQQLIADIEEATGTKLRIFSDIIAGSSAGGINGVFLAQAIVTGQSLEPLTDLWLKNADVETLVDPDARPFSRFSKFWAIPLAWMILRRKGGAIERTVSADARQEVAAKLSRFVRARWFKPPFGGRGFSGLLLNAFDAMAKSETGPTLLPSGQPLDLFVTVTDFAGHDQMLRLNSPPVVFESEHRITISFTTRGAHGNVLAALPELVFAARATASFPGAFPPFSARELDNLIAARNIQWPTRNVFLERILPMHFAEGRAADTMLIDGSVLANAPFRQVITALRNRPARREVDRRIIYIDPKPGMPSFRFSRKPGEPADTKPPGWLATIFGATSNIPREQPIRDSLEAIENRSAQIERMRQVTGSLHDEIERTIEDMLGKTWFLSKPTPDRITKWRGVANKKAAAAAGYSYPAYGHLKFAGVVDDMIASARRACFKSPPEHFSLLKEAVLSALRARGLQVVSAQRGIGASDKIVEFFRAHDVRYRIRRLRFLARRLSEEIESSSDDKLKGADFAANISAVRATIYDCLAYYLDRETATYMGEDFTNAVQGGVADPDVFIDLLSTKCGLVNIDLIVDRKLCDAFSRLESEPRRIMLLGYLGYPLYDIATLPLLQGEGLDEFDPVKVDRISPDDAIAIRKGGAAATLKGIELSNFGAFFSRTYRENDYLWGRLHGADRLIDIILSSAEGVPFWSVVQVNAIKARAFRAILDSEEHRLTQIKPLIDSLRAEISKLAVDRDNNDKLNMN